MSINLELYKVFYMVAKAKSISKAAKLLFTSQPAVSQSIKSLEQKLDAQLFYRTPKGVVLTSDGMFLFQHIEQWYGLIKTSEERFAELKNINVGKISIAICSAVCKYHLMSYLEVFHERYPNIKIFIQDKSSKNIVKSLETGETDIGVINLEAANDTAFHIAKTFKTQDCFVAGAMFRSRLDKPLPIKELVDNDSIILLEKGGSTRAYIDNYFFSHGIEMEPHIELSSLDLLIEFTKRGFGVSCVAKEHVKNELESGELFEVPVIEKIPKRVMGIVTLKGFPQSKAAQAFTKIILDM